MNMDLFNKIAEALKKQFPDASPDLLLKEATRLYEAQKANDDATQKKQQEKWDEERKNKKSHFDDL
jgi:hypothetical protein